MPPLLARTLLRNYCSCPFKILYCISMFSITHHTVILIVHYLATSFDLNIGHHHGLMQETIMPSCFFHNDLMMTYTQVETRKTINDQKWLCCVIENIDTHFSVTPTWMFHKRDCLLLDCIKICLSYLVYKWKSDPSFKILLYDTQYRSD